MFQLRVLLLLLIITNSARLIYAKDTLLHKLGIWVFKRLVSLSATYIQESAIAAMGEWRDGLCCLKLLFTSLDCVVCLQLSYFYLHIHYTNSTNLKAIVGIPL